MNKRELRNRAYAIRSKMAGRMLVKSVVDELVQLIEEYTEGAT